MRNSYLHLSGKLIVRVNAAAEAGDELLPVDEDKVGPVPVGASGTTPPQNPSRRRAQPNGPSFGHFADSMYSVEGSHSNFRIPSGMRIFCMGLLQVPDGI